VSATEAAVIYCLEVVFTAVLAASGLVPGVKEFLTGLQVLGGVIILGAMFLVELAPRLFRGAGEEAIG
jgi:drug/metabolite transporter (DMT)-like permease